MPMEIPLQGSPDLSWSYSCTAEGPHDIRHSCMWIIKAADLLQLFGCGGPALLDTKATPLWFHMYMHYTILLRIYKLLP